MTVSKAAFLLLLIGVALTGCTNDGYPTDNTYHVQGKAPSSAPPPSTFVYRYPDNPAVVNAAGLRDLVSQYRHRVILLDFWATWSQANREEMSMLARLQDSLRDDGLQVIACAIDDPDKWSQTIVPILHDAKARFPCVVVPEENRSAVRKWLEPGWNYEIPARFVIGRQGDVVMTAMSDIPLASVEAQVRELVLHGTSVPRLKGAIAEAAHARGKLIDVNTGKYESLSDVSTDEEDPGMLAEQLAEQIARKIGSKRNARIAILPFPPGVRGKYSDDYGKKTAEMVEVALRERGYQNFLRPAQVEKRIKRAGLSTTSIEYDPTAVRDALDCDYLVIGWVRQASDSTPEKDDANEGLPIRKSRVQSDDEFLEDDAGQPHARRTGEEDGEYDE